MINTSKSAVIVSLALMVSLTAPASADDRQTYTCSTMSLLNAGNDQDFIEANLEKRFLIQVGDEEIHVLVSSPRFNDHNKIYRVFHTSGGKIYGIERSSVNVGVLALSEMYFRGAYQATITVQTPLHGTVWKLSCQKF